MGEVIKELSKKNPYYISKERHLELIHFCRQYPEWTRKFKELTYVSSPSQSEVKSTDICDSTYTAAVLRNIYSAKIGMVEHCLQNVIEDNVYSTVIFNYMLDNIVNGGSYEKSDLPGVISEYEYRNLKRKFFYILDKVRD